MVEAWRSMGWGLGGVWIGLDWIGLDWVAGMIAGFFWVAKGWNGNELDLITSDMILQ